VIHGVLSSLWALRFCVISFLWWRTGSDPLNQKNVLPFEYFFCFYSMAHFFFSLCHVCIWIVRLFPMCLGSGSCKHLCQKTLVNICWWPVLCHWRVCLVVLGDGGGLAGVLGIQLIKDAACSLHICPTPTLLCHPQGQCSDSFLRVCARSNSIPKQLVQSQIKTILVVSSWCRKPLPIQRNEVVWGCN
jgi:hypothetical protein